MAFTPRFLSAGRDHFFLLGPRGTGKTLWCNHEFPNAPRIDLLDPATLRQLSPRPERLRELIDANPSTKQIFIDEIQKLPELLEVVHLLSEKKTVHQLVLTGSSFRKLRRGGVNLIGGRAAEKHLHPYMAAELAREFSLNSALQHGMLPVIWAAHDRDALLSAYNGLYLREEVQMEGLVRNTGSFARFLEAMSYLHGSVLNLASVARDCHVNRKTAEGYLGVLEDLLLGFRLNVFTRRAKRELATHPKFYYFDTGVFRANRPSGPLDSPGGHFKIPHPWPGQNPPPDGDGQRMITR